MAPSFTPIFYVILPFAGEGNHWKGKTIREERLRKEEKEEDKELEKVVLTNAIFTRRKGKEGKTAGHLVLIY